MKAEFNFRSLVKALAHDISPVRIHEALKASERARRGSFYDPESRMDVFFNKANAVCYQAMGMDIGFGIGMMGALGSLVAVGRNDVSSEMVTVAVLMGGAAGAALFNPVFAKGIMKYYEVADRVFTPLFNKIAKKTGEEEREINSFPPFEAFPALKKALAGNELKPQ